MMEKNKRQDFKSRKLIIIGASGHGRVVADIAKKNGYENIFFLDDNTSLRSCGNYTIIGTSLDIKKYHEADFVVAIGNAKAREKIQRQSEKDVHFITLIHPEAVVASDTLIGPGTVVMAGAVINSGAVIGKGCIINTCSSVDHDCQIGDFVHISVGAHIAGTVVVGNRTWIGIGASVINNTNICSDCMIGAGAVVIKDILRSGTYIGLPAKEMNMKKKHKRLKDYVVSSHWGGGSLNWFYLSSAKYA